MLEIGLGVKRLSHNTEPGVLILTRSIYRSVLWQNIMHQIISKRLANVRGYLWGLTADPVVCGSGPDGPDPPVRAEVLEQFVSRVRGIG